jgi:hypothetical protein
MSVTLYNIDAPDMDDDPSQLQFRKLKMKQNEPTKNRGLTPVLTKGKQFLLQ